MAYVVGMDPNVKPEKQGIKPIVATKTKVSQIKPRSGQGRVGLRHKIKTLIPKSIAQVMEKAKEQPKSIILDKVVPIPNYHNFSHKMQG